MDAQNCNLLDFIHTFSLRKRYGVTIGKVSNLPIVNFFLFQTGCGTPSYCEPLNLCSKDVVNNCNITLSNLIATAQENERDVLVELQDITNGTAPYTYTWNIDSNRFNILSQTNNQILLQRKDEISEAFTTPIAVLVTDYKGCFESITINYDYTPPA